MPAFRTALLLALSLSLPRAAIAQERVLTRAIDIRALSPDEAESGIAVRLRGVVVFVEGVSAIFVQDQTSTTFFRVRTPPLPAVGDEVEIVGQTRMGLYLPGVGDATFRVLGRKPLPPGIPVTYDDLHFGRQHYRRVVVDGIVRSIQRLSPTRPEEPPRSHLRLAMGSRVIDVRIEAPPPARSLVDHRVRITGLAAGLINSSSRQLVQPYVRVLNWDELEVLAPAPSAADVPQISAEELLAFRVTGLGEQRVRIDGIVSGAVSDSQVYLQQGTRAFAVRFGEPTSLAAGDHVTVVGFPSMERFSASVIDAELLSRAPGQPPAPVPIASIEELYGRAGDQQPGRFDGHLVRLTAPVKDVFRSEDGNTLLLQQDNRTLQVRLAEGIAPPEPGSLLRLTGICQVESVAFGSGFGSRPGQISLRIATTAGLDVVRRPPWWTPRRLSTVLAALAGVVLLAGLWIVALRRQVARQTAALRQRIESEAALEERQRIAREFHDTLEQELAGVSLRLDALATRPLDDKGRNLISASRNLVSRIQTETRELISDLRDPAETAGDLAAALGAVAARQNADTGADVRFEAATELPPLAPAVVHALRMIARESVTNAIKHGRATHIRVLAERRADALHLRIEDNGCGFDPRAIVASRRGHFGCAGIRERARKVGAHVVWQSTLQKGTTVAVTMPLVSRAKAPAPAFAVEPPPIEPAHAPGTPSTSPPS